MTASSRTEDKALVPSEDKADQPVSAKEVRAASRGEDAKTIKVVYVHHRGEYKPGDVVELPAARATQAIAARVAKLAE